VRRRRHRPIRLLLPTDFSLASETGESEGARPARSLDAEIVVLHVVQDLDIGSSRVKIADLMAMRTARLTAAKRALGARVAALRTRGLRARGVLSSGSAHRQIVEIARSQGAAMIVMATRGRGRVARWLLGSTTERVIRLAPCPVLTVLGRHRRAPTGAR
jgi:nucleotide-binding universal stress UspA family protein